MSEIKHKIETKKRIAELEERIRNDYDAIEVLKTELSKENVVKLRSCKMITEVEWEFNYHRCLGMSSFNLSPTKWNQDEYNEFVGIVGHSETAHLYKDTTIREHDNKIDIFFNGKEGEDEDIESFLEFVQDFKINITTDYQEKQLEEMLKICEKKEAELNVAKEIVKKSKRVKEIA